jgi:hypothetical protein
MEIGQRLEKELYIQMSGSVKGIPDFVMMHPNEKQNLKRQYMKFFKFTEDIVIETSRWRDIQVIWTDSIEDGKIIFTYRGQ